MGCGAPLRRASSLSVKDVNGKNGKQRKCETNFNLMCMRIRAHRLFLE